MHDLCIARSLVCVGEPVLVQLCRTRRPQSRSPSAAFDDGEVQVGEVAVVGEVDEAESAAALENGRPPFSWLGVVEPRDLDEDVGPLHNRRIDPIGIRSAGEGVAGEHDQVPDTVVARLR